MFKQKKTYLLPPTPALNDASNLVVFGSKRCNIGMSQVGYTSVCCLLPVWQPLQLTVP